MARTDEKTHEKACDDDCVARASIRQIAEEVQRPQSVTRGYVGGSTANNQTIGKK